ncbi:hypothetical protein F5883DRAFT_544255 [Diaporthe sp. PMI_573]|nr:hypothetical protein F5883DRAFT_544255 [Diaporthaceae sp. PMI_573]
MQNRKDPGEGGVSQQAERVVQEKSPYAELEKEAQSAQSTSPPEDWSQDASIMTLTSSTTSLDHLNETDFSHSRINAIPKHKNFQIKHFWWDIRQVHPWTSFNTSTIISLSSKPLNFLPSLLSPHSHLR